MTEPRPSRTTLPRMSDEELTRLRAKVDGGTPLTLAGEASALLGEMMRATAAVKPAATTLNAAVLAAGERAGRKLGHAEIATLWEADAGLRSVKHLYDRERARWRRANGILRESNLLARGEAFPVERRAPYPVEPAVEERAERRRRRLRWL